MSFQQQLREWLGGLWSDFWNVPFGRVLTVAFVVVWAIIEASWKTWGALNPAVNLSYHAWFPLRIGVALVLLMLLSRRSR